MTVPFLISIDTEGDNLWSSPRTITTRNALFLPRFQALCESYGHKPTYLTNFEMATCPHFRAFARDVIARGAGEVGMHLHAWNCPPLEPLTGDDWAHKPYLIEYPERLLRAKIRTMTALLENTFERKMVTHRAGRWAIDGTYVQALIDEGYLVDTSVTPHISWQSSKGDPNGVGGTDYTNFPERPYFLDPAAIDQPRDDGCLLEVPMTTAARELPGARYLPRRFRASRLAQTWSRLRAPLWLRPRRRNAADLRRLASEAANFERPYAQLMIHSSELMPGGSPTFPDERSISELYDGLAELFETFKARFVGITFAKYRTSFDGNKLLAKAALRPAHG